ncbi:MAG: hypothetical protein R3Y50_04295 [Rikenellaceae bacterium]
MVKEILCNIEDLHDFMLRCADSGSMSLIEKDIILQDLRSIYVACSKIEPFSSCEDATFDDENDDLAIVHTPIIMDENGLNVESENGENQIIENCSEKDGFESVNEHINEQNNEIEQVQNFEQTEEQIEQQVEEKIAPEIEEPIIEVEDLGKFAITHEQRELYSIELFDGDSQAYNNFIGELEHYDDFNEAVMYIYDTLPDKHATESIAQLTDKIQERLN